MTNDNTLKPLPCPFCGSKADLHTSVDAQWEWIRCSGCNIRTEQFFKVGDALRQWNTRHESRPIQSEPLKYCTCTGITLDEYLCKESIGNACIYCSAGKALTRGKSEPAGEGEAKLREWLWLNHGCPQHVLYGDDGEMQCAGTGKHILDFKRDPLIDLIQVGYSRGLKAFEVTDILKRCNEISTGGQFGIDHQEVLVKALREFSVPRGLRRLDGKEVRRVLKEQYFKTNENVTRLDDMSKAICSQFASPKELSVMEMTDVLRKVDLISKGDGNNRHWNITRNQAQQLAQAIYTAQRKS